MLPAEPTWTFPARKQLTQWYGHVHLGEDKVIGQWFSLDRATGDCHWEKELGRPNSIYALTPGIILAEETRSDGPWTCSFGCYAIDDSTGETLWAWHGQGLWGGVVRLFDRVPGFTNELRPNFRGVNGSECLASSGWVLDRATGKPLRKESKSQMETWPQSAPSPAQLLYQQNRLEISAGLILSNHPNEVRRQVLRLTGAQGTVVWEWGPHLCQLHESTNFYGWRLCGGLLYLVAGEEPATRPDPRRAGYALPNKTNYHLIALDVATGQVWQKIPVTKSAVETCRIEDVDERGILISHDNRFLSYYCTAAG